MRNEVIEELRDCRRRVAPLSHYAALSFVVIGGGQSLSWGLRDEVISNFGFKRALGKKKRTAEGA